MKKQVRIIGIDDSPFTFSDKYTDIIGVVMRGGEYIEGILRNHITIDGSESTSICSEMINLTRHKTQLRAAMLDGVTFGGFNVIDIKKLFKITNVPVITITRKKPNFENMKKALKHNFKDWESRLKNITYGKLHEIATSHNPIYVKFEGIKLKEVEEIIKLSTLRGVIPEPIRIAHLIASGISRGESYGKA